MFFGGERFPGVPIFIFLIIHYRSARFLFCLILFACLLLGDVISLFSQLGRNIDLLAPLARISTIDHQQGGKELFLLLFLKKKHFALGTLLRLHIYFGVCLLACFVL